MNSQDKDNLIEHLQAEVRRLTQLNEELYAVKGHLVEQEDQDTLREMFGKSEVDWADLKTGYETRCPRIPKENIFLWCPSKLRPVFILRLRGLSWAEISRFSQVSQKTLMKHYELAEQAWKSAKYPKLD